MGVEGKQRELFITAVQAKDNGGFYCVHLTDKEIVTLGIYTIVTASLALETLLGSQLIIFLSQIRIRV